ncbi:MAG TPA: hypothetical protein VFL66_03710 [Gaiellaceae bacterium]|nr:hypothetical protein [Gaiellaceae bacterium]
MQAALNLSSPPRGAELLLRHCAAVGRLGEPRLPAASRLEQALGHELTELLLHALAPHGFQGRRGSSSP